MMQPNFLIFEYLGQDWNRHIPSIGRQRSKQRLRKVDALKMNLVLKKRLVEPRVGFPLEVDCTGPAFTMPCSNYGKLIPVA